MASDDDMSELLFFDTFSHDINEELNLDLVQFPNPVYITELRIIPLGARVEADFRGGVRLGATNPSSFEIDFFVNDLTKPGASTFEKLGNFMYNQNDCINMVCEGATTIPTDGLVLRGWYTTITLAVYGTLTKNIMEQIASPPAEIHPQSIDSDKRDDGLPVAVPISLADEPTEVAEIIETVAEYTTPPKDPRQFPIETATSTTTTIPDLSSDWEKSGRGRRSPGRRKESETRRSYSRSSSRDGNRDWSRSPDPFPSTNRRLSRGSTTATTAALLDARKRPRTPPITTSSTSDVLSPTNYTPTSRRPRSPDHVIPLSDDDQRGPFHHHHHHHNHRSTTKDPLEERAKSLQSPTSTPGTPLESPVMAMDEDHHHQSHPHPPVEQFELIESDEEIGDDMDQFDLDFDEYEESMKLFNPLDIQRFPSHLESRQLAKEFDVVQKVLAKFSGLRRRDFDTLSRDEREAWVHGMERVVGHLGQVYHFQRGLVEPFVERLVEGGGARETILQGLLIGLDYDCAMSQVAYKVRHLKVGLKFAELIGCYDRVAHEVLFKERCDLFRSLFALYDEPFMAMSLQMMILKTIGSVLDTKAAVQFFLGGGENSGENYYQRLLNMIEMDPKIYLKFALKALVKKLNVFETLECVKEAAQHDLPGDATVLNGCLTELLDTYVWNDLGLAHSKHFVPVPQKIEIVPDEMTTRSVAHCVDSYFRAHSLLEALSLLVVQRQGLTMATNRLVIDMLRAVARNSYGFLYLVERFEATMVIVRSLLQNTTMEDWNEGSNDEWLQLGVEIAYKLQTKYHLDAIQNLTDEFDIVDHLTALYNLTITHVGRPHVLDVLCMNDHLAIIRQLIEAEKEKVQAMESSTKYKSPTLSYAVDVLDVLLRHGTNMKCLQVHGKQLLAIVKSYDIFESNVSAMLQELLVYLKPLDQPKSVFSYDDSTLLCDLMRKSFEFFTTFPGDLITCLRIARHMAIPSASPCPPQDARKDYQELKHKLFLVQFYSAEGYSLLVTILEKTATHFQQPKMHSSNLVGQQGVLVLQVLLPTVQILRHLLVVAIEARNTNFRDVTVMPLLHVYNLLHNIPATAIAFQEAQQTQVEIIQTLLCYTQATPPEGVDNESVMKSLWSQVVGEVIKFTLLSPSTFIPGLMVLSEMLPLPLPIPTTAPLPSDRETQRVLTERQLWSAYLHPQTNAIVELIQTLSPTSYPPLIMLLVRVCLQMADLGPNMSVVVARTILELFMSVAVVAGGVATSHHLRLMNYLGNLVGHASIKAGVLSLLSPRLMEMWSGILTTYSGEAVHQQTQESVLILFQSLLDCENSFYAAGTVVGKETVLASVIPTVEMLQGIVNSCLDHMLLMEEGGGDGVNVLPVLRNLMLFTEHDVTIRILRSAMDKRRLRLLGTFRRLVGGFMEGSSGGNVAGDHREVINSIVEFLRLLMTIDGVEQQQQETPVPSRTVVLTAQQLGEVLSYWTKEVAASVPVSAVAVTQEATMTTTAEVKTEGEVEEGIEGNVAPPILPAETVSQVDGDVDAAVLKHPILELREFLELNRCAANDPLLDKCNEIISYLEAAGEAVDETMDIKLEEKEAPLVPPPPEGIVTQYAGRQVYTLVSATDERLTLNYWLNPPNYEMELGDVEQVPCDLTELIKICLPADTNLVADCKRILNLSVSPQSNREGRTVTAPCFRTRRIEMEPIGGRMEKKMFGKVPMRGRGFARTPPSRGDLFRSRPPNTSRPPSLHVDDFLALEGGGGAGGGGGGQNSGPSGYNKSGIIGGMRGRGRGRGGFQGVDKGRVATGGLYRQSIPTWSQQGTVNSQAPGESPSHFRTATQTPQYGNDAHHYHRDNSHFVSHPRGRGFYRNRNYPR